MKKTPASIIQAAIQVFIESIKSIQIQDILSLIDDQRVESIDTCSPGSHMNAICKAYGQPGDAVLFEKSFEPRRMTDQCSLLACRALAFRQFQRQHGFSGAGTAGANHSGIGFDHIDQPHLIPGQMGNSCFNIMGGYVQWHDRFKIRPQVLRQHL